MFRGLEQCPSRIDSIRRAQVAEVGRKQMCRLVATGGGGREAEIGSKQANELAVVVTLLRALMGSSIAVGLHGGLDSLW